MKRVRVRGFFATALVALVVAGCPGGKDVEIAVVVPETGAWSHYGTDVRHGVEIALDHLTASASHTAPTVQWLDSASDPAKARQLLEEAFQGSAYAAIGGVTSVEAAQMVPIAATEEKVLISPSASDPALTETANRYFFRVIPSDFDEATRMAKFAVQDLNLETVMILAAQSSFGTTVEGFFRTALESEGATVLETMEYPAEGADWNALAAEVITQEPQGVYVADFAGGVRSLIQALRTAGYGGAVLTNSAFSAPSIIATTKSDGIYLTRLAFDTDASDERVRSFVDAYQAKYSEAPSLYAALGYDSMMLMGESLAHADGDSANRLWQHVRGLTDFQGVTGPIQFDESGDAQRFPQVYLVREGKLVSFSNWQEEAKRRREELLRKMEELQRKQRSIGDG